MRDWEEVTLESIEEGELAKAFNRALAEAAQRIVLHRTAYGEASRGGKAAVTVTVEFSVDDPENNSFVIVGKVATKFPGRPARPTLALGSESADGRQILVSQKGGTAADNPRQKRLDFVDRETGEVKGEEHGEQA